MEEYPFVISNLLKTTEMTKRNNNTMGNGIQIKTCEQCNACQTIISLMWIQFYMHTFDWRRKIQNNTNAWQITEEVSFFCCSADFVWLHHDKSRCSWVNFFLHFRKISCCAKLYVKFIISNKFLV